MNEMAIHVSFGQFCVFDRIARVEKEHITLNKLTVENQRQQDVPINNNKN